ncbi:uncharacterized protein LOC116136494 [Pistacia vera]|uniref:uncharacterized protein LOC116136494 n=1 Tax=Pistacia vera TaxID=55513 RepID=UPI001262F7B6|nr:uncharacterized protein LOC116136494 [Pistacia vera]
MNKKKDKEFVDKMIAKCFVVNNIAFNVVQTGAFGEFVKAVAEYGVAYKLPSYSTLRTKLIPESRKGIDAYVAMVKCSWDTSGSGCTIMSDIWINIRHRSFINLVTYSPSDAMFIKSLDLLLKEIYEEVNWVKVATDEARIIVMFMTRYTVLHVAMKKFTKDRQLRQPCATRFASNFLMLQFVLDLENELRLFVASTEWRGFDYCKTESGRRVTKIVQSDFWARGREVIKTIEPLVRVLRLVDGDGSTAGYLYEAMMRVKVAIKEKCNSEAKQEYGEITMGMIFLCSRNLEKLGELPDYEYEEIHMDEDANFTPTVEGYMDDLMDNDDIAWLDDALF